MDLVKYPKQEGSQLDSLRFLTVADCLLGASESARTASSLAQKSLVLNGSSARVILEDLVPALRTLLFLAQSDLKKFEVEDLVIDLAELDCQLSKLADGWWA